MKKAVIALISCILVVKLTLFVFRNLGDNELTNLPSKIFDHNTQLRSL